MAVKFADALEQARQSVDLVEATGRNHFTEILLLGQKEDPVARAMTRFLAKHAHFPAAVKN
jgi:hypothetical protein